MRRRCKVWYSMEVPGLWWCGAIKQWVATLDGRGGSSHRDFKTAKRCFGHAKGLKDKGYKPFVTRLYRKRGRLRAVDYGDFDWGHTPSHDAAIKINEEICGKSA